MHCFQRGDNLPSEPPPQSHSKPRPPQSHPQTLITPKPLCTPHKQERKTNSLRKPQTTTQNTASGFFPPTLPGPPPLNPPLNTPDPHPSPAHLFPPSLRPLVFGFDLRVGCNFALHFGFLVVDLAMGWVWAWVSVFLHVSSAKEPRSEALFHSCAQHWTLPGHKTCFFV